MGVERGLAVYGRQMLYQQRRPCGSLHGPRRSVSLHGRLEERSSEIEEQYAEKDDAPANERCPVRDFTGKQEAEDARQKGGDEHIVADL